MICPEGRVCLTVDVEWAHPEILAYLLQELEQRHLRATFFCTHAGIEVPGHERALHPNFRRSGDIIQSLRQRWGDQRFLDAPDEVILEAVVAETRSYASEAIGVRAHCLYFCSELIPIYHTLGLRYHSGVLCPLQSGLAPYVKEHGLLEMPIFYMDHLDLIDGLTGFRLPDLRRPGLKVFDFHPNMVYLNAQTNQHYVDSKSDYHHPEKLRQARRSGRGAQTIFLELLDWMGDNRTLCRTLREVITPKDPPLSAAKHGK